MRRTSTSACRGFPTPGPTATSTPSTATTTWLPSIRWILRDASGDPLYIPFDCDGGSCTQYAGDIGNPHFRAHWIAEAKQQAARYRGIFVDDVNLEFRVSNGAGEDVVPRDPRTGAPMREADWRRYMAEFTEQVRAAMPNKEIVHNALWFTGTSDPFVRRQVDAATHVELERGVNDPGLTGAAVNSATKASSATSTGSTGAARAWSSTPTPTPAPKSSTSWPPISSSPADAIRSAPPGAPLPATGGRATRCLGAPRGGRFLWRGLLRRDFERGFVLVNQPDRAPVSVTLGPDALDPEGVARPVLRLNAAEGAVVAQGPAPGSEMRPVLTRTVVRPVPNAAARYWCTARSSARDAAGRVRDPPCRPRLGQRACPHDEDPFSWGASSGASVVSPAAATGFVRCSWARIEPARRRQPDGSLCAAEPERL